MKDPVKVKNDYGASFLTGGLIAVGLLVSTIVGTELAAAKWAPEPKIIERKTYIDNQDAYFLINHKTYDYSIKELNACVEANKGWDIKWREANPEPSFGGIVYSGESFGVSHF